MCLSCGCGEPNNSHSKVNNITMNDIERAARAGGITSRQAAENILGTVLGKITEGSPRDLKSKFKLKIK